MKNFYSLRKNRLHFEVGVHLAKWYRSQDLKLQTLLVWIIVLALFLLGMSAQAAEANAPLGLSVVSQSPVPGTLNVPIGVTSITITFDGNYKTVGGKSISLRRYDTDGAVTTTTFNNQTLFTTSYTIQFEFTEFLYGKKMYVLIDDGAFTDHSDNTYSGNSSKDSWTFTIQNDPAYESNAPVITSKIPNEGSIGVGRQPGISFGFDEYTYIVSGKDIEIRKYATDDLIHTIISYNSASYTNYWNISEQIETQLDFSTKYYILMDGGVFKDKWDNLLPAITDKDAWTFTTEDPDTQAPDVDDFETPEDDATDVGLFPNSFYVSFDEYVQLISETTATVTLKKQDGSTVKTFTSGDMSVDGSGMELIQNLLLEPSTSYYFTIDAGLLEDESGNDFPGFTDPTTWNFTTRSQSEEDGHFISSRSPGSSATGVSTTLGSISIAFVDDLTLGNGVIRLKKSNGNSLIKEWDLASSSDVTVTANELELAGIPELEAGFTYFVETENGEAGEIPSMFYFDNDSENYAGWLSDYWTFTTEEAPDTAVPYIVSISPLNGANGVSKTSDVTLTFDEIINSINGGVFAIYRYSDDAFVKSRNYVGTPINSASVSFTGNDFAYKTKYYVTVQPNTFKDLSNNVFAGFTSKDDWNFTTEPDPADDQTAPVITFNYPESNSTDISRINTNLNFQFDESVRANSGKTIEIRRYSDDEVEKTISVFSGNLQSQWNTGQEGDNYFLSGNTKFYVLIEDGLFEDKWGNTYGGISNKDTWTFTTKPQDATAPLVSRFVPADGTRDFHLFPYSIQIKFNEFLYLVPGTTGQVHIFKSSDSETPVFTFEANELVNGATEEIYLNIDSPFEPDEDYYVTIDAETFQDREGNTFAGFTNPTTWNFRTTGLQEELSLITAFAPEGDETGVSTSLSYIEMTSELDWGGSDGYYRLRKSSDNSVVVEWQVDGDVEFSYDEVSGTSYARFPLNITLEEATSYYVDNKYNASGDIEAGLIQYSALIDEAEDIYLDVRIPLWEAGFWSFTTEDPYQPQVEAYYPLKGDTEADIFPYALILTMDREVEINTEATGKVEFIKTLTNETLKEFEAGVSLYVNHNNSKYTIELQMDFELDPSTMYHIKIGNDVFKAINAESYFLGFSNANGWSFTTQTVEQSQAIFNTFTPARGATDVAVSTTELSILFNEEVYISYPPLFKLRKSGSNELVKEWDWDSDNSRNGNTVTFEGFELEPNTTYYIEQKADGGNSAFVTSFNIPSWTDDFWVFTTGDEPTPDETGPQFVSGSPVNGATGVGIDETITLTFDEDLIIPGNGATKVIILRSSDQAFAKSYSLENSEATISGNQITIPTPDLPYSKTIHFEIYDGVVTDAAGNWIADTNSQQSWTITTEAAPDTEAPYIVSISPGNGAQDVSVNPTFTVTYNEAIVPNTSGFPFVRLMIFPNQIEQVQLANTELVQISDNQITIQFTDQLEYSTGYLLATFSGMVKDLAGNANTENPNFTFTTEDQDLEGPQIIASWPALGATQVPFLSDLELEFDEPIFSTGNPGVLEIYRASDDLLLYDRLFSQVTVSDNKLLLPGFGNLPRGEELYILMDDGLIRDNSGNEFAGISDVNVWRFTIETKEDALSFYSDFYPAKNTESVSIDLASIQFTVSESFTIAAIGIDLNRAAIHLVDVTESTNPTTIERWSLNGDNITILDNEITVNQIPQLEYNRKYAVVLKGVFTGSGVSGFIYYGALIGERKKQLIAWDGDFDFWTFTTESEPDTEAPTIVSFSPSADATEVDVYGDLTITFSENIVVGSGNIQIQHYASQSLIEAIDVTSNQVRVEGSVVTITPSSALPYGSKMYVIFLTGTFEDLSGNAYEIDDVLATKGWSFTTESVDITNPQINTFSPLSGASSLEVNVSLSIAFREPVRLIGSTGLVRIFKQNGALYQEVTIQTSNIAEKILTIPHSDFEYSNSYFVLIGDQVLEDLAGNDFLGISSAATWAFSTKAAKQNQTISFTEIGSKNFGDPAFQLTAQSTSGLTVQFTSSNENVIRISGSTATVVGAGEVAISASQAGSEGFNSATSVSQTIAVNKAAQVITIQAIQNQTIGGGPIPISAQVNSGLLLTYTLTGPATLSGTLLSLTGQTGVVTLMVSQDGNENYQPASKSISFLVADPAKQSQTISFSLPTSKVYGDAPFDLLANSSSGSPVIFSILSGSASVAGTKITIHGAGAITVRATQDGNELYNPAEPLERVIEVSKAPLSVSAKDVQIAYGQGIPDFELSFAGLVNGDSKAVVSNLIVSSLANQGSAPGTYPITLSGGFSLNYSLTLMDGTLTITKAPQVITLEPIDDRRFGESSFTVEAASVEGLELTLTSSGPISLNGAMVSITGAGQASITASNSGNEFYEGASMVITFTIAKATAIITLADMQQITTGSELRPTISTDPENLEYEMTFDGSLVEPSAVGMYHVIVTILDDNYEGEAEGDFVVIDSGALGLEENEAVTIYPNPSENFVMVKSKMSKKLTISDTNGRIVKSGNTNIALEVSHLSPGVYFIQVGDQVLRLLKQ